MTLNKNQHDISQIFLVYMALVGDAAKTALALDLDADVIEQLAKKEGWAEKVRRISLMSKSGKPGDYERAQNRALNFVQCHQLRRQIDRAIAFLSTKDPAEIVIAVTERGEVRYSAKVFTDIAKTMQSIHEMTYSALGDTVRERESNDHGGPARGVQDMHSALLLALHQTKNDHRPAEELIQSAAETAIDIVAKPS